MLESEIYRRRFDEILHFIESNDFDFALLTPSPNFQYLSGSSYQMHERLVALIIKPNQEPKILTPSFELSDHQKSTWLREFLPWSEEENPFVMLASELEVKDKRLKAMFDENLPIGIYWSLERALGGFEKTMSLTPVLNDMRLIKGKEEISKMKHAGEIIDKGVRKAFDSATVGMTELELMQIVQTEVGRLGAANTFSAIQFGDNSAVPHARAGPRELRKGDLVLMDCGCSIDGYNTDMTRVGVVGEPNDEQEEVYSIVLRAEETALERLKKGLACGTADGIARRIIEEAGYGDQFTHRLGHGIGLEVHEPPYIVRGNARELESGMTHSVEPGIYLDGKFGIRIEDLICITETGVELLTITPKDFFVIDGR